MHPTRAACIKLFLIGLAVVFAASVWLARVDPVDAFSAGPPPGYSGAPGEDSCTECHSDFKVNSGDGSVQITGLPHDYRPGQIIQVNVKTTHATASIFGFQLTAIDSTGKTVGHFSVPQVQNPPSQLILGSTTFGDREYVEQTTAGLFDPNTFGSNTWHFTWTAPAALMGKISFYAAGNGADSSGDPGGDYIYTSNTATLSGSAISNFDGDFASDIAVFRPRMGKWYSRSLDDPSMRTFTFGAAGDRAVPGDYDGDGITDLAVFTPSTSQWKIQLSSGGASSSGFGCFPASCGTPVPVQGDYDGDGKTDIGIFNAATGAWTIRKSSGGIMTATLGTTGDKPVQADYDGDGKTDVAVFRPSNGTWYLQRSSAGATTIPFGISTDLPVQGDYDGDGRADIAYFRPSNATWYIAASTAGSIVRAFGTSADVPSPGDYDGDGKTDIAGFQPGRKGLGGTFHVFKSSDLTTLNIPFGQARDIPVASAYLAQ